MSNRFVPLESIGWSEMLDRVDAIVKLLKQKDHLQHDDRERALSVMRAYTSKSEDFKQFVQFSQVGYTKNFVTEIADGLANVIVMCWAPRQASAFHGHEGSRCFVKVLDGELLEERTAHPDRRGNSTGADWSQQHRSIMHTNEVTYIDDSIGCHRVTNKSASEPAVSLHVYTPPYRKCRLFEVDAGHLTCGADCANGQQAQQQQQQSLICMERSRTIDVTFDNNALVVNQL